MPKATDTIIKVNLGDEIYPGILAQLNNAPKILHCRGNLELFKTTCFSVVGTRSMTTYGRETAQLITAGLVQKGFTIVSGLALGVDAIAHQTTLNNRGKTIAVLGGGVDDESIGPKTNFKLAMEILKNDGLLVSEYEEGSTGHAKSFPERDRIISGLSVGVLVVEAPEKSGALITAQFALEQNRDVFAVPGNVFSPNSIGSNKLLQKGAKLVISSDDIIEEYRQLSFLRDLKRDIIGRNETESEIIDILKFNGSLYIDDIIKLSGRDASEITTSLSIMEVAGQIKDVGNGKYILQS